MMVVPDKRYDLLIVGLGPAGVSCALQAHRDGLDSVAVGDEPVGGLVRAASRLTNLAGASTVSGWELAQTMEQELAARKVPMFSTCVVRLVSSRQGFEAQLRDRQIIRATAVCLATGTRPAPWSLGDGLEGIHRDARSLPNDLPGSSVAIIGGGEAALDTALSVIGKGGRALVISRTRRLRAAERLIQEAQRVKVKVRSEAVVAKIAGGPGNWMLTTTTGDTIPADLLVVCIGRVPCDELLRGLNIDTSKYATTGTGIPGLWVAGDLLRSRDRYVALAMGDGQRVALAAARYIRETA